MLSTIRSTFQWAILFVSLAFPLYCQPPAKPAPTCLDCGEERWDIKTLSDPAAKTMNFTPKPAAVSDLTEMPAPASGATRNPSEMQTYTVKAKLVGYKIELKAHPKPKEKAGDHDFHIVIQDPTTKVTMVAEIPDVQCSGACTSLKKDAIAQARKDFAKGVTKQPGEGFFTLEQPADVEVTGVAFFDFAHGQTGLAPNCVELHPVLQFKFVAAGKVSAKSNPANEPKKDAQAPYKCLPETHMASAGHN